MIRTSVRQLKRSRLLGISTTAAIVVGGSPVVSAWLLPPVQARHLHHWDNSKLQPRFLDSRATNTIQHSRLYSSNRDKGGDQGESSGFLSGIWNTAKSFLPTRIFGTEEEKERLARKDAVKNKVSGGLKEALKDAPPGIRLFGRMLGPMLGNMAARVDEAMSEQQQMMEDAIADTHKYLMADPVAYDLLGEPITVSPPVSKSVSTININGKVQSKIEMMMPVQGPYVSGYAHATASQDGISNLRLEAAGRRINVKLSQDTGRSSSSTGSSTSSWSSSSSRDDNIIEAEIVEKKSK
eukprot:Nitzschia sp. Nitz4//scaffold180_size44305//37300//38184//NITZ4_007242-RA/size44305-processed-gene-0.55-mRNA-1//-1//CDS//3329539476//3683//frame0